MLNLHRNRFEVANVMLNGIAVKTKVKSGPLSLAFFAQIIIRAVNSRYDGT